MPLRPLKGVVVAVWVLSTLASPSLAQVAENDAGSGRDAGATWATAVPVDRHTAHTASVRPQGDGADLDWFTFDATAGEEVTVTIQHKDVSAAFNCITIFSETSAEVGERSCQNVSRVTIPADGTYVAQIGYELAVPHTYVFAIDPPSSVDLREIYASARDMEPDPERPTVIVAVADTGVNPYHEVYHRPKLTEHPCTWVTGFGDCSVPALHLSIGVYDTYEEAYEADRQKWNSVQVGRWYWIPGTNIIGAVCDGTTNASNTPPPPGPDTPCIHDEHGHGTATTSSVLSEVPEALLLVHEGNTGASAMAHSPVVPDMQSHSWAGATPAPFQLADPVLRELGTGFSNGGAFDPATIFFIAAGNEAPFPTIIDFNRVHPDVQVVGGGYPGKASLSSWSTFDYASWLCRPTATHESVTGLRERYCGTSFSAPTVAGAAAGALLELRRAEGYLGRSTAEMVTPLVSREAFIAALRSGATYQPEARFNNTPEQTEFDLPQGHEHLFWGYGWLDASRIPAIVACAAEGECPPASADAERWNASRQTARRVQSQAITETLSDPPGR